MREWRQTWNSQMQRKRPHWEREELIQVFLLGLIAAQPKSLDSVEPSQFSEPWASGAAFIQKALKGDTHGLDVWLRSNLGVERANGTKVLDAVLERFQRDAAYRKAYSTDAFMANLARLREAMSGKRT